MTSQEGGPASVAAKVGADGTMCERIVVLGLNSDHSCACGAIEVQPSGEQFLASPHGTHHHNGVEWRRIADFAAFAHWTCFDNPAVPIRLVVRRGGQWMGVEVPRDQWPTPSWIGQLLGGEAAASVTDYEALQRAIVFIGFAVSECRGCRRGS